MKFNIQLDMTPEEARKLMGLPDVTALQDKMLAEMERRMKVALDASDPEAMFKAWLPMGAQGFEQFQRFLWESARAAAGGSPSKDSARKDTSR
ncbi:MAG: hypothetical protein HY243_18245 [Proteobacteria bacterium]|nr:hypothetical protein [Pseudomonadota bacterium]